MVHRIRFSLADDSIIRNLKGEPVYLYDIVNKTDYPIWGILLINDSYGSLAVKQLCKGELKIKKIVVKDCDQHITLSRKIRSDGWDTEFCIGENNSLVSLIWSESPYSNVREFDIQAIWTPNGGFTFRKGAKDFFLDVYGINSVGIYTVYFECDISELMKEYSSRKWVFPCIPYVQTLEGQDPETYSIHYFNGTQGSRQPQFKPSPIIDTVCGKGSIEDTPQDSTLKFPLDTTIPYSGSSDYINPRAITGKVEAKISTKRRRKRRRHRHKDGGV